MEGVLELDFLRKIGFDEVKIKKGLVRK